MKPVFYYNLNKGFSSGFFKVADMTAWFIYEEIFLDCLMNIVDRKFVNKQVQ